VSVCSDLPPFSDDGVPHIEPLSSIHERRQICE
jgi:hypothetical protein